MLDAATCRLNWTRCTSTLMVMMIEELNDFVDPTQITAGCSDLESLVLSRNTGSLQILQIVNLLEVRFPCL